MTRAELNRAVSQATGEDLKEVRRRGFQVLTPVPYERESDDVEDLIVDWDDTQLRRNVALVEQRHCEPALA